MKGPRRLADWGRRAARSLWPVFTGETLGWGGALLWLACYGAAAWLTEHEGSFDRAGRLFLNSRLGMLIKALCARWLPRLLGSTRLAAEACRALTELLGTFIHVLYTDWLAPSATHDAR